MPQDVISFFQESGSSNAISSIFPIAQSTRIKKDGDVGISNYHSAIQDLESIGRV
jgi:hypothetical protein